MAEPEDVIAEGALVATRLARELWARRSAGNEPPALKLKDVRRRLDLLVATVFPQALEIETAEPPASPTFLARLAGQRAARRGSRIALASTDGQTIWLPGDLGDLSAGEVPGRYRLLALEQAARACRDTPAWVPSGDLLLSDLVLLSEAVAVDQVLVRLLPGLAPALRQARAEALSRRGEASRLTRREQAMEELIRVVLNADPGSPPTTIPLAETPLDSLAWAYRTHPGIVSLAGAYRGMNPVSLWGVVAGTPEGVGTTLSSGGEGKSPPLGRTRTLPRRPRVRAPREGEDDATPGTWIVRADDPQEKVEDPAGLSRPADRDSKADPGELADALSELPEARLVRTPGAPREVLVSDARIQRAAGIEGQRGTRGVAYPEWDWRVTTYHPRGAIVWDRLAVAVDGDWADRVLRRHGALVRGVRRDFERLRPRRTALRRQPDGAELDIDALVDAFTDRHGGGVTDDRFYVDSRPLRRDVAIALLVDASASTDSWVSGDCRIIDVEKEALLVVSEALTALGDPYAILAFSGEGPGRVDVCTLKQFEAAGTGETRRRVAALEPEGYTRAGAAIRHATAALLGQAARHRLLLLLSDGRPNDTDLYEGRYGVEDTRVAVAEARLQDVHCFCLTVDREAPRYAARIFGPGNFAVLERAERLPTILTLLLRDLVRG